MKTFDSSFFSYCVGCSGFHCTYLKPQTLVDSLDVVVASTTWLWLLEMLLCKSWMRNNGCCCKEKDLNEKNFLHNIVQSPNKRILALFFFGQFCDLAKMGKIHRKIPPKWAKWYILQFYFFETPFFFGGLSFWAMYKILVIFLKFRSTSSYWKK